jgi:antitoxin component YwqK of YwqJK toxin-antitoxin module
MSRQHIDTAPLTFQCAPDYAPTGVQLTLGGNVGGALQVELREIHDASGRRLGEAEYVNGKLHGRSRIWTPGGVLVQESHFRNGEKDGPYQTWWDNGQPKEVGTFSDGKRVGIYRWFHDSGELWQEHNYDDAR